MRRAPQSPPGRTANRWDSTCTSAGKAGRSVCDKIGYIPSKIVSCGDHAKLSKLGTHRLLDIGAFQTQRLEPSDKNDVPSAATFRGKTAVSFFDNAAAAVTLHCAAELFARRDADTTNARAVFQRINNQRRTFARLAASVDAAKVGILTDCCNCFGHQITCP